MGVHGLSAVNARGFHPHGLSFQDIRTCTGNVRRGILFCLRYALRLLLDSKHRMPTVSGFLFEVLGFTDNVRPDSKSVVLWAERGVVTDVLTNAPHV